MKKSSSTIIRAAKSSGGPNKATSNRQGGASSHTKQSSQRPAAGTAPAKKQAIPKDKVEFSGTAKKQLDKLGINGKQRQEVESWHKRTVRREMNHIGADHAKIRYLAHSEGSRDNRPHITASLKSKEGGTIKNDHGNLAHVYYDGKRMPPVYTAAVQKMGDSP